MKTRALHHLCCPVDRGDLELHAWDSRDSELESQDRERAAALGIEPESLRREVVTGILVNPRQRIYYPILNGVPRLLAFRTTLHDDFAKKYRMQVDNAVPGCTPPNQEAATGEGDVLRSFSAEWRDYGWEETAYWNLAPNAWFRCMEYILDTERFPLNGQLVLEAGIGNGGTADHLARNCGCEVVGFDLGQSVDVAARNFGANPFLHIVQASVFAPPFRAEVFDFVYSFGVLHHTYSTRAALAGIAPLTKEDGRLFVWVYSSHDETRTLQRRLLMRLEKVVRPIVCRLREPWQTAVLAPILPLYMVNQVMRRLRDSDDQVLYGVREALHAARDRFTPRYIHRHTDSEMKDWFEEEGYAELVVASERERPEYVPEAFTACTGIAGRRLGENN